MNPENFMISESASLPLPFHQEMDEIREDAAGRGKNRNYQKRSWTLLRGQS